MPSYTKAVLFALVASHHVAIGAPIEDFSSQVGASYSGKGGNASGGSSDIGNGLGANKLIGLEILKILSDNAGNGGNANSGEAVTSPSSVDLKLEDPEHNTTVDSAFTGSGGDADGGNAVGCVGLIKIASCNAGNAGNADSGAAGPDSSLVHGEGKIRKILRFSLD